MTKGKAAKPKTLVDVLGATPLGTGHWPGVEDERGYSSGYVPLAVSDFLPRGAIELMAAHVLNYMRNKVVPDD